VNVHITEIDYFVWTDDRVAELKRLFETGISCAQIGAAMGIKSRNSIIGKLHRLGLRREKTIGAKQSHGVEAGVRTRASRSQNRSAPVKAKLAPIDFDAIPDIPVDICPNRVTLLSCEPSHCRWPAADDGSADMVCGDPKVEGRSWCARHCRIAFRPAEPRRRAA
jgi:GcrA cell cycle regulator